MASRLLVLILLLFSNTGESFAFSAKKPEVLPVPSLVPLPIAKNRLLEVFDYGMTVDKAFTDEAVRKLNEAYDSGCILNVALEWYFRSLNTVQKPSPKFVSEAMTLFFQNAPYSVAVKWYYKPESSTIGYTYNYFENTKKSEYRIWTNKPKVKSTSFYAAHLAHELSHQIQAGGFVHYTIHEGSFPYEIGDIVSYCLNNH